MSSTLTFLRRLHESGTELVLMKNHAAIGITRNISRAEL